MPITIQSVSAIEYDPEALRGEWQESCTSVPRNVLQPQIAREVDENDEGGALTPIRRTSGGVFIFCSISLFVKSFLTVPSSSEEVGARFASDPSKERPNRLLIIASDSANARECSNMDIPVSVMSGRP